MDPDRLSFDLEFAADGDLVALARSGDRLAFGVLFLRHHEAAWRVASVVTGFSDDAEVAVIEGFSHVFSILPRDTEGVAVRPYLLACVRQAARNRPVRLHPEGSGRDSSDRRERIVDLSAADEIVLDTASDHVLRSVLRSLPELSRSALWLTDVEALTPTEVGAILDRGPAEVTTLAADARVQARHAAIELHQQGAVRAGCRFSVENLRRYLDGTLSPRERSTVKAHIDHCVTCRMRRAELANLTWALAAAMPPSPVLGGECQQHWMAASAAQQGMKRALPPGRAAAGRRSYAPRRLVSAGSAAVAAVLAVVLGIAQLTGPSDPSERTSILAAPGGDADRDAAAPSESETPAPEPAPVPVAVDRGTTEEVAAAPVTEPPVAQPVVVTAAATGILPGRLSTPAAAPPLTEAVALPPLEITPAAALPVVPVPVVPVPVVPAAPPPPEAPAPEPASPSPAAPDPGDTAPPRAPDNPGQDKLDKADKPGKAKKSDADSRLPKTRGPGHGTVRA